MWSYAINKPKQVKKKTWKRYNLRCKKCGCLMARSEFDGLKEHACAEKLRGENHWMKKGRLF